MMKILISSLLLVSHAMAWEVVKKKDHYYLEDNSHKESTRIATDGQYKDLEVKSLGAGLELIFYTQSVAGTKYPVHTWYCALYGKEQKEFIFVDQLCRTKSNINGKEVTETALIEVKGQNVIYQFEELDQSFKLTK